MRVSPRPAACGLFLLTAASAALAARPMPSPAKPASASPAKARPISYQRDVKPILVARCYACHGNGSRLGGFQIDSRQGILQGGQNHPAVVPGDSGRSLLIKLVSGAIHGKVMPPKGPRLTVAQIDILRGWIDQGLPWDSAGQAAAWKPRLALRRPPVPSAPPGSDISHPIDRLLQPYFVANKVKPGQLVDDRTYARRVYQDIIGLPPPPSELEAFVKDADPGKRSALAKRLLADNRRYAEHWLTFWNDMLRNDYAGTGYIDGGRTQITDWLLRALETNLPYSQFVAQLVNPTPESAGFVKGIVWRGVVNASQTPQMQAAQNISQVFMGVNLKCASCHNSFINTWKLADAYGMASIYAEKPLEMVRCDKPTGEVAPVQFLYPELGKIDGAAPREQRIQQLATVLTTPKNGRLARTMVNRIWARLMGRGLVEPTDEMDNRPWNPDLLDWLASDFFARNYDVKKLIERIVTSRAYQLPAMPLPSERVENFVFAGPTVKRLTAEQLVDAVSTLTGVWSRPARQFRMMRGQPMLPPGGRSVVKFRSGLMTSGSVEIDVDVTGAELLLLMVTDAGNGGSHDWADWAEPRLVGPNGEIPLTDLQWQSATTGYGQIQINKNVVEKPIRLGQRTFERGIGTHANSVIAYRLPAGVTRFRATAGPDAAALEEPGSQTSIELFVVTGDRSMVETRAALALADPLMLALGRPNREQVVTVRPAVATTLEALELTNGDTLARMLAQGAEMWTREAGGSPTGLVETLYRHALGRAPTPAEQQTAEELVGSPVRKEGVEDLLWALVMLPEFQLVY
jgi:mono/diheme cytochrome c family protein